MKLISSPDRRKTVSNVQWHNFPLSWAVVLWRVCLDNDRTGL